MTLAQRLPRHFAQMSVCAGIPRAVRFDPTAAYVRAEARIELAEVRAQFLPASDGWRHGFE
jgi:hypothetical protein